MAKICKVLVVEDHEGVRALLGQALKEDGFNFTLLSSRDDVRGAIEKGNHEIVVIDVPLESGDCFTLAALAAEEGMGVILTAGHEQHLAQLDLSGHRHILKPFKLGPLLSLIDEVLRELETRCIRRKSRAESST